MSNEIINKVANSKLVNLDLEDFYPKGERVLYDIKQNLWQELVLKEKDFRKFVKENDWSVYQDKFVAIYSSADAVIPSWAYMILTNAIGPFAKKVVFGSLETLETVIFSDALENELNPESFQDKMLIIKGCGSVPIHESAYVKAVNLLKPFAKSIMFGEACSAVPVFKRK